MIMIWIMSQLTVSDNMNGKHEDKIYDFQHYIFIALCRIIGDMFLLTQLFERPYTAETG